MFGLESGSQATVRLATLNPVKGIIAARKPQQLITRDLSLPQATTSSEYIQGAVTHKLCQPYAARNFLGHYSWLLGRLRPKTGHFGQHLGLSRQTMSRKSASNGANNRPFPVESGRLLGWSRNHDGEFPGLVPLCDVRRI